MRRHVLCALLGMMLFVSIANSAVAEDVYVTKYGKKYHKEGSRFIKNKDVEKLSREEAESRGYEPSSDFLKEDQAGEETKSSESETVK
ncbi:MAG: hypothetical protein KC618_02095 [Candidatus Omnitrophica bacterium]|nr:hypothetical protein [Candidatus Omnitrophota bacterium]